MDQKPMKQQDDASVAPLLLSIRQTAKLLNLGCTKVYELIATEGLPTQRFGRARRVVYSRLLHWLEQREAQQQ